MKFAEYNSFNLSEINKEVLGKWDKENVFEKSMTTREGCPSFVFYEGPPSANGMPGIHHVMARSIKDIFCRFKTMKGYQVKRKAGWDTHGLPVELGVEKSLGITKEDIGKKISVDEYNATCRKEVMKYTKEWTDLTHKMGYWVDLDDPYITYDNVMVWLALKKLASLLPEKYAFMESRAADIKKAVYEHCVFRDPEGRPYFGWSTDLEGNHDVYDEPPGSLQLLPFYGFCSADDEVWLNTVSMIRSFLPAVISATA